MNRICRCDGAFQAADCIGVLSFRRIRLEKKRILCYNESSLNRGW